MCQFLDLPNEIVAQILLHLPPAALSTLVQTSQKLSSIALPFLYSRPCISNVQLLDSFISALSKNSLYVKRLNLASVSSYVTDRHLEALAKCQRIERVGLSGCRSLTEEMLVVTIRNWGNLQSLELSDVGDAVTGQVLDRLSSCHNLRHLYISSSNKVNDFSVERLVSGCRHLTRLPQLLELDLSHTPFVTDELLSSLFPILVNLRELRLAQMPLITDEAFSSLPATSNLRLLDLTGCMNISDVTVCLLAERAMKLRHLELAKCHLISDVSLCHALPKLAKTLTFLHLGHCVRITDTGVISVARNLPKLKYLDIGTCARVTDRGISEISRLKRLCRLGIVRCIRVTELGLYTLIGVINRQVLDPSILLDPDSDSARSFCNSLERIHLSYCLRLTREAVLCLLKECPNIKHISLTGIEAFQSIKEIRKHSRVANACVFSNYSSGSNSDDGIRKLKNTLEALMTI